MYIYDAVRSGAAAGERAAALYRQLGDEGGQFRALSAAAVQWCFAGDEAAAARAFAQSKALVDPGWPAWARARLEQVAGAILFWGGRPGPALAHIVAAYELNRAPGGNASFAEWNEVLLLGCESALRNFDKAAGAGAGLLAKVSSLGSGVIRPFVAMILADAQAHLGDLGGAEAVFRAALPSYKHAAGTVYGPLHHLAFLLARQGRLEDAAKLIGFVDQPQDAEMAIRHPGQQMSFDDALDIVSPKLGAEKFRRLRAEGATLSEERALQAFLGGERG
jgi:hypothetical protein